MSRRVDEDFGQREPGHRADDDRAVNFSLTDMSPAGPTDAVRRQLKARPTCLMTFAGELVRTSPPCISMYARAGSAYISSSGLSGERQRRIAPVVAEHLGQHARKGAAGCDVDRLVERARQRAAPTASRSIAASDGGERSHSRTVSSWRGVKPRPHRSAPRADCTANPHRARSDRANRARSTSSTRRAG